RRRDDEGAEKGDAGWIRGQSTRRRVILGVPTGARNTGMGAPTGDQSAGTNRTPNPPAVSQGKVIHRFPEGVRKSVRGLSPDGRWNRSGHRPVPSAAAAPDRRWP